MSTRAYIGVADYLVGKETSVKYIYCHNDGYVEGSGVGSVLVKHFDNDRDAHKLIDLGDLSFLYDDISLDEAEELASRTRCVVKEINDCCAAVYTGSDSRSAQRFYLEDYVSPKSSFRKDAWDIEYFYLFADNEWYVSCAETEWKFKPVLTLMNMKESRRPRGRMIKEDKLDFDPNSGTLWHTYSSKTASKVALFLKLAKEAGHKIEQHGGNITIITPNGEDYYTSTVELSKMTNTEIRNYVEDLLEPEDFDDDE